MIEAYKKLMNATFRDAQRHNLIAVMKPFLPAEPAKILDVGTGDGEFAWMIQQAIPTITMHGVEVIERGKPFIPITLYDGHRLPFVDNSFDFVTIINMLHHTADPKETLKEAIRVSRKGIIIKEHYADNWFDYATLTAMEYLNPNARKLMEMPLRFYTQKEWNEIFKSMDLVCEGEVDRFVSYGKFWDLFFGRHMHFVGRYHHVSKK